MFGDFRSGSECRAASIFPSVSVSLAEPQFFNYRCGVLPIFRAQFCKHLPKVQKNAPSFLISIDESALL